MVNSSRLEIGPDPAPLMVRYIPGESLTTALILKKDGVAYAWPAAPLLVFADTTWAATLSDANTKATWTATSGQVDTLDASADKSARITVSGQTWWIGWAEAQRA